MIKLFTILTNVMLVSAAGLFCYGCVTGEYLATLGMFVALMLAVLFHGCSQLEF
jgi:hypothetical protein